MSTNPYCGPLGIEVPRLEQIVGHREASTFTQLMVALLERGEPMTLEDVAQRMAQVGFASAPQALASLRKCRPATPPVYRDGERYTLDPYDEELDLWAFRLGLRPAKFQRTPKPPPPPLPTSDVPLSLDELSEAFDGAYIHGWSMTRIALTVLDAHRRSLSPAEVVDYLDGSGCQHRFDPNSPSLVQRNSPITVGDDGRWSVGSGAAVDKKLRAGREQVRKRIEVRRRYHFDPEDYERRKHAIAERNAARAAHLASLRRAIVTAFPVDAPRMVAVLDVNERTVWTGPVDPAATDRIAEYDFIAGVDIRTLLRGLGIDPTGRRLAELGAIQKSVTVDDRGRTIPLTTELLIRSTCGIKKPLANPKQLQGHLERGETSRLSQRLREELLALYAYYEYARLHAVVLVTWRQMYSTLPVSWRSTGEPHFRDMMHDAYNSGATMEIVRGAVPDLVDPWADAERCGVAKVSQWRYSLVDATGFSIPDVLVLRARVLPVTTH